MASGTSDLIVRLSLYTTQFEGSLSKFEGQTTKLQASCTNATTGITNFKQVTAQLQTSAQTLTDKLAAQKQKVACFIHCGGKGAFSSGFPGFPRFLETHSFRPRR
ncbi:MAG: hypothetical protein IJ229_07830 [Clostridia bacterium]|nr:hypothetical protein [Clostridia bacterium]MBR1684874.1 hypothetical protein [Clostridia bacterium]